MSYVSDGQVVELEQGQSYQGCRGEGSPGRGARTGGQT